MNSGLQTAATEPFSSQVWWAKAPSLGMLIGRALKPTAQPVFIISLPRSGSSWIGDILGNASTAMYLREPMNQSHLAMGGATTVFDIDPDAPPEGYARFTARTFQGIPVFPQGVVQTTQQWSLRTRHDKVIVIKDVNPLALPWILQTYQPRVIYLMRHPAAVASSYWNLGWRNAEEKILQFGPRLLDGVLKPWEKTIRSATGFWQAHGVFQAAVHRVAIDALANYEHHRIVSYEQACTNPESTLLDLLDFAQLNIDDSIKRRIADSTTGKKRGGNDAYGTQRNSRDMAHAWASKVDASQLAALHSGYSAFGLPYYNSPVDWSV